MMRQLSSSVSRISAASASSAPSSSSLLSSFVVSAPSTTHLIHQAAGALLTTRRWKGDFGFNVFHNSNPQHGGAYARHERRMRDDEFEDFHKSVKGWDHDSETHSIWRSFYFETYDQAYLFFGKLYAFCYGADKYPHVTWENGTRIDVELYSPTFKGLSKREARVAAFLNDQYNQLKKGQMQQETILAMMKDTTVEKLVGEQVRDRLAKRDASRRQEVPELQEGGRTTLWKDLLNAHDNGK